MDRELWSSRSFRANRNRLDFIFCQIIFVLCLKCCDCISHETEAAMRDFSKLRLEQRSPTVATTILSTEKDIRHRNSPSSYHEQTVAATDDMSVAFKPSYPDVNSNSQSSDEIGFNSPSHRHQSDNNLENSHSDGGSNPEDYPEPGVGGFFPPLPSQNPSFANRPLIGGPGPEEDISSVGMSVGPAGYSSEHSKPHGNKNNRRPEMSSSNPDDDSDDQEDIQFIPVPPSRDFLTGIEHGDDGGLERGYGGLFDGDTNDADGTDENEQNPEAGYFSDDGDRGYGPQHQQSHQNEGPDSDDSIGDDSGRGYGSSGGPSGSRSGASGSNNRYNLYDYGDY